MFRKSSNNPWISPSGRLNTGSFAQLGGTETVGQRYPGLLGQTIVCDTGEALKLSDSTVGTLYQGVYQLVKLNSNVSHGQLVFWDTLANNGINDFEVTSTVTAPAMFKAGVALCTGTSGEYAWIQIAGLANCLYVNPVTDATLGNLVLQNSATTATVDAITDAGAFATALAMKRVVGVAYETPSSGNVRRVLLNLSGFYQNIA